MGEVGRKVMWGGRMGERGRREGERERQGSLRSFTLSSARYDVAVSESLLRPDWTLL